MKKPAILLVPLIVVAIAGFTLVGQSAPPQTSTRADVLSPFNLGQRVAVENNASGNYRIFIYENAPTGDFAAFHIVTKVADDYLVVEENRNILAPDGYVMESTIPAHSIAVIERFKKKK